MKLSKDSISELKRFLSYWHESGWKIEIFSVYVESGMKWNVTAMCKHEVNLSVAYEDENLEILLTQLNDYLSYVNSN